MHGNPVGGACLKRTVWFSRRAAACTGRDARQRHRDQEAETHHPRVVSNHPAVSALQQRYHVIAKQTVRGWP